MESCLYVGWVKHRRFSPVPHHFRYGLFLVCLDLTDLDAAFRGSWTWSWRRPGLAWFRRGDHLGDPQQSLETSIRDLVEQSGRPRPRGKVLLLTHLRYFGFVFNPVSFYFCLDGHGQWETMVAEVSNTPWNQKHCYIVDRAAQEKSLVAAGGQVTAKVFHVSPFLSMDYGYRWSVKINPAQLVVHIENIPLEKALGEQRPTPTVIGNPGTEEASAGPPVRTGRGGKVFNVTLSLQKRPLSRFQRWRVMMAFPAITGLVVWRIYWQAFRLWWKRVPYVPHPGLRESQQSTDGGDRGPISVSS